MTSQQFDFIPVSAPDLSGRELQYVTEALRATSISGTGGKFLTQFEGDFAAYCGCRHGIATSNGTTALHLALAALGIGPGDEVLVSTFTNMATFFAPLYLGARPVPVDIEPDTWNMNPALLPALATPRTRAIIAVHIYGHPVDMDPVLAFAAERKLTVIEDAAQAHGATYKGRRTGSLGDIACFSFYANKILTTGEGGMVVTSDPGIAAKARLLSGLAYGRKRRFMHQDVGFNYRLTNLQAALGCAQLERVEETIAGKRRVAAFYDLRFSGITGIQRPVQKDYARSVFWMYHLVLRGSLEDRRDELMRRLAAYGIESREAFTPFNLQRVAIERGLTEPGACPVANRIAANGFYLPSSPHLSDAQLGNVADRVVGAIEELRAG